MSFNVSSFTDVMLCLAILGSFVFLLKTFLPIDFNTEVAGDFTSMTESDASINLFSIESISAFFMCFGWIGWLCLKYLHYSGKKSLAIAFAFGLVGMFFFAWLIAQFRKLEHVNMPKLEELVGKTGKAYMNFAPKGNAKIQIEFNAKLETLDAINASDEEIKSFENIKVVKIENNQIYIEKGA